MSAWNENFVACHQFPGAAFVRNRFHSLLPEIWINLILVYEFSTFTVRNIFTFNSFASKKQHPRETVTLSYLVICKNDINSRDVLFFFNSHV
jgi:hypothetical protein